MPESVPGVNVTTTYDRFRRGDICLLDVREPDEWQLGHIEGAELIPLSQLGSRWQEIDTSKKWVCVCRSGSRSEYAAGLLRQTGLDIANMEGGMLEWKANELPITPPGVVQSH
jgi:rhodanese-related sulfurtransferase